MILHDVYSEKAVDLNQVCQAFGKKISRVNLAFTPNQTLGFLPYEYKTNDSTFFVKGDALKSDMKQILSFPEISHA